MKIYLLIIFYFLFVSTEAQVEDRFDDGDFTDSPVWSGNDSDFNVNTERQLQLNAALSGNSFLSVPVNLFTLDSCEWNFYIKLAFSPSTSNFARVYISSDQQDITQPLNGYFLQFGESLSSDAIELFRQDGTSITSVCRARDGFIATAFSARIKLTRDQYGWWTLYADYSGGANYKTEARGNDLFFNSASWMGVDCRYTSGNVNKFYFDDFYAGREIPDTTLPYVSAVEADSVSVLTIIFSEKMDSISITDINNYLVDNNIGHPVEVKGDILNQQKYYLRFTKSFQQEVNYTISFSGLGDVNQNQIKDQIKKFIYSPVMTAHQNDVVFSEIYFENSKLSPLPDAEYIEIFNRMDSSVLISGWKISDGNSDGVISEFRLGPRSYVILYNETDSSEFFSVQNGIGVHSFPSLNNDVGDHLILSNANGEIINEVDFNDNYYHNNNKNDGGWSIEKVNTEFICSNEDNWSASKSIGHGTPGLSNSVEGNFIDANPPGIVNVFLKDSFNVSVFFSENILEGLDDKENYKVRGNLGNYSKPFLINKINSREIELKFSSPFSGGEYFLETSLSIKDCPGNVLQSNIPIRFGFPEIAESGDMLINELLFNPFEGGNDFVELFNCSKKIIDLKGWEVTETDFSDSNQIKDAALISTGHRLLFPSQILVLTEDDKKVRAHYFCSDAEAFLNVASMPDFNSDEGRVVIFDQSGNVIDAFRYSEEMHFPLLSDTKGVSLERLSISEKTDNKLNWHSAAATVGFATPGYVNSQRVESVGNDDEVNLGMEIFSPDNDGYDDVLTIHYQFPQAGTVLSLNIFDYNGQPVRALLNGQTISNEGMLIWDGLTDEKTIASRGIYILLARSFDLNGNEKVIKKSFYLTRRG